MELEKVTKITEITKDFILTIAVLAGGGWALYKYITVDSASARIDFEIKKSRQQSVGNITTDFDAKIIIVNKSKFLYGNLIVKNVGSRKIEIDLTRDIPIVAQHLSESGGQMRADEIELHRYHFITSKLNEKNLTYWKD